MRRSAAFGRKEELIGDNEGDEEEKRREASAGLRDGRRAGVMATSYAGPQRQRRAHRASREINSAYLEKPLHQGFWHEGRRENEVGAGALAALDEIDRQR